MLDYRRFLTGFGPFVISITLTLGAVVLLTAAGTWSLTDVMSVARVEHRTIELADGRVLTAGGYDQISIHASAEIYEPATGSWSTPIAMNQGRYAFAIAPLSDGRVIVSGGANPQVPGFLPSAEIYDPTIGTWVLTGSMNNGRRLHTATLLADGRVLVAGGQTVGQAAASAEIFDPTLGTWSNATPMAVGRFLHSATRLLDGRVLVAGGYDQNNHSTSAAEIYDPVSGTWSITSPMNTSRGYHPATMLSDGRVLVSGGYTAPGGFGSVSTAEIFDPTSGAWSPTNSMATARGDHSATRLADGRMLIVGGWNDVIGELSSVEIYDPALGTWSAMPSLNEGRYIHTASLLPDGRVLINGGYSDSLGALSSAEVYTPPPQVVCGAADTAWHSADVTVACTASDPAAALANPADASFGLSTSIAIGTETADAATNSRNVCNTVGGCTMAGPITGNKVDKKPPVINITTPGANAAYQLNATVAASYACADGGAGVGMCQGTVSNTNPIDTSSTGTKTFTVTAADAVGNPSSQSVTYSVVTGGGGGSTSADLGLTLQAPSRISPGSTLVYSMKVANSGKATATGVVASNVLPAGTVFASASSSQGSVTAPAVGSNGTVSANLGSLANSATATISIVVTVTAPAGTVLNDTATVTATTQDLNGNNNSDSRKTTVSKN